MQRGRVLGATRYSALVHDDGRPEADGVKAVEAEGNEGRVEANRGKKTTTWSVVATKEICCSRGA